MSYPQLFPAGSSYTLECNLYIYTQKAQVSSFAHQLFLVVPCVSCSKNYLHLSEIHRKVWHYIRDPVQALQLIFVCPGWAVPNDMINILTVVSPQALELSTPHLEQTYV